MRMHCDYCSAPLPEGCDDLACADCQRVIAADADDAALEAAMQNNPRERDRAEHAADLAYEYSKPEYHDEAELSE